MILRGEGCGTEKVVPLGASCSAGAYQQVEAPWGFREKKVSELPLQNIPEMREGRRRGKVSLEEEKNLKSRTHGAESDRIQFPRQTRCENRDRYSV